MKYLIILSLAFFTGLCKHDKNGKNEEPLAQVGSTYLFPSDIKGLIKKGLTKEDSITMVNSLAEKWIRKQLIVQKAELNLSDDEKDVNKELEEYRTSLVIYKYEQKLIKEKLDTLVSNTEIEEYYNQNPSNFVLSYNVVKAQFIKLPLGSPHMEQLHGWLGVESSENIKNVETYCYQYAKKYDYFNDSWVILDHIKMLMPGELSENAQLLRQNKIIEMKDSAYIYIVNIRDIQEKGTQAPFAYVEKDIKSVLILKRKQKLINDLENKIYFDAMNKNNFTIFKY